VVDSPGDNLLAEFASAVDAVRCAVELQRELKVKNADLSDSRRMEYRIGLNVGDVIVEGARLYGDGVNIAARLEGLAEPGGICIAGTVYDQVENKLALGYDYGGNKRSRISPSRCGCIGWCWRFPLPRWSRLPACTQPGWLRHQRARKRRPG